MTRTTTRTPCGGGRGFCASWRMAALAVLLLPLLGGACTNTYVDYPKVTLDKEDNTFTNLIDAVEKYENTRIGQVQKTRNWEARYRQAVTVVTFGALAAGGAAALYDAHTDLVLGFGLAGAGAYGLGNQFWSPVRGRNLNRGNAALQCVVQTGADVVATDASLTEAEERIDELTAGIGDCTEDEHKEEKEAVALGDRAIKNIAAFRALDASFAAQLHTSANAIITALNESLEKTEATPAAALRAGQAVSRFAAGFATGAAPPTPTTLKMLATCESNSKDLARDLKGLAERIEATMAAKTNKMAALATQCVFQGEALQDLAATPDQVNIAKDVSIPVTVTGAFGLLTARWVDAGDGVPASTKVLEASVDGADRITIKGNSELQARDKPYTLEILDQRPVPTPVRIAVTPTG